MKIINKSSSFILNALARPFIRALAFFGKRPPRPETTGIGHCIVLADQRLKVRVQQTS
jgi:hypothetical protein